MKERRAPHIGSLLLSITVVVAGRAEEFVPLINPFSTVAVEGQAATLEFGLDDVGTKPASASYRLTSVSATPGEDYIHQSGVVTFAPGERQKSIELQLIDDSAVEGQELILLELSDPHNARLDTNYPGRILIEDNETPVVLDLTFKPAMRLSPSIVVPFNNGELLLADMTEQTTTLRKLKADGSLDSSFTSVLDPSRPVLALAQTTEGAWLVGGLGILKLTETGAMDPNYAPSLNGLVRAIALQPDGKILLGGPLSTGSLHGVVRLEANGVWDSSFQGDLALVDVSSIVLQPDGRMIVTATVNANGNHTICALRLNADGTLDPAFPKINIIGPLHTLRALRQADGKILIHGHMTVGEKTGIVRINADGTLDETFKSSPDGAVIAAVLDEKGSIWIAGSFSEVNGFPVAGVAKLTTDGMIDRSFLPGTGPALGSVAAMGLSAGRLYVGGNFHQFAGRDVAGLARLYTSNATLSAIEFTQASHSTIESEPSSKITLRRLGPSSASISGTLLMSGDFHGPVPFTFSPLQTTAEIPLTILDDSLMEENELIDLALSENTPVMTGYQNRSQLLILDDDNRPGTVDLRFVNSVAPFGIPPRSIAVFADGSFLVNGSFKIMTNGMRDTNFVGESWGEVRAIDFQSDGKIIIAGRAGSSGVARLHTNGTLDNSFNEPPLSVHEINAVRVLSDDRIMIGGLFGELFQGRKLGLMRLMPNGVIDRSFAPDDAIRGPVLQMELQDDNKVFACGYFSGPGITTGVLRFNANGSVDTSFYPTTLESATISAIKLQPDGKLLVARESFGAVQPLLFRVTPNGALDSGFQVLSNASGVIYNIALQHDGKIVLGGNFVIAGRRNLVRLFPDGKMDQTFDAGTGPNDAVSDLAINPTGQIALAGWFGSINSIESRLFAVVHSDVPLRFSPGPESSTVLTANPGSEVLLEQSGDLRNWHPRSTNIFETYTQKIDAPPLRPAFLRAKVLSGP